MGLRLKTTFSVILIRMNGDIKLLQSIQGVDSTLEIISHEYYSSMKESIL